jgi:hypothetical protein
MSEAMAGRDDDGEGDGFHLTPEQQRRRRARNLAIAGVLAVVIILFYVIAMLRFGGTLGVPAH